MSLLKSFQLPLVIMQKVIRLAIIFSILFLIPAILPAQVETGSFRFEGIMRSYIVVLPQHCGSVSNLPVVFNLHGNAEIANGQWQMDYTLMHTVADTAGFMVVYPNGVGGFWNYNFGGSQNDVGFISALIDTLNNHYSIDLERIYACGHSGGGLMSCKLACQLSDRIAAIANEAGGIASLVAGNCDIKRPMPALIIHGTADPILPYSGEPGIYSAEETVRFFAELNDCSQSDTTLLPDLNPSDGCTVEKISYSNISTDCQVVFYKVINGGHLWPGAAYNIPTAGNTNRDINANIEMWNFFKQHELSFPQHDVALWSSPLGSVPILATNITPLAVVKNFGLNEEVDILVTCEIDSAGSLIYSDSQTIDSLRSFERASVVFKNWCSCDPFTYKLSYYTRLSSDENVFNDTLAAPMTVSNLMDDFESGMWKWSSQADWGVTVNFSHSGKHSLTTGPAGSYKNNSDSWVIFKFAFDFSQLQSAHLSFWTRYFIEKDHDFGFVEVSVDGGQTWHQLGEAYTGFQSSWIEHSRSLTAYCGAGFNDVRIRFRFVSDSKTTFVGWMIDDVSIYSMETAVVDKNNIRLPEHFVLSNNYPNPFNSQTIIEYQLPRANNVKVIVYNLRGQQIKTLIDQPHQAGAYQITWDGLDSQGLPVTAGIYFYAFITDDNVQARKMTLIK